MSSRKKVSPLRIGDRLVEVRFPCYE